MTAIKQQKLEREDGSGTPANPERDPQHSQPHAPGGKPPPQREPEETRRDDEDDDE
jgi:hypothetical protein